MSQSEPVGGEPSAAKKGEVISPKNMSGGSTEGDTHPAIYADIVAQINKYTDRPDLLLEAIERHDPGFIKRMNSEAERFSKKSRDTRFRFGRTQAYVALGLSVAAAFTVLYCLFLLINSNQAGFWTILGLALLYAVTQGGSKGFLSLIEGIKNIVMGQTKVDK